MGHKVSLLNFEENNCNALFWLKLGKQKCEHVGKKFLASHHMFSPKIILGMFYQSDCSERTP